MKQRTNWTILGLLGLVIIIVTIFELYFWFGSAASEIDASDTAITIDGIDIAYTKQLGTDPAQPAIVLIHSGGWSGIEYNKVKKYLNVSNTIYTVDMPGFGRSSKPQVRYTTDYLANYISEFVKQLPEEKIILVGASVGGTIALQVASEQSDKVSGLVLIDPFGFGSEINQLALWSQIPILSEFAFHPNKIIFDYILNNGILSAESLDNETRTQLFKESRLSKASRSKLAILRNTITTTGVEPSVLQQVDEAAQNVDQPMLLLWGDSDSYSPISQHQHALELMPQAKYVVLEDTGHFSHMESPKQVANQLEQFVKETPGL